MDTAPIAIGTVLGETYEITRLLGQGGMGAVWEAKHLRLPGKRVAVKVLLGVAGPGVAAAMAIDREAFARFRREAEIASQIGHPNIVEVLDFNTLPGGAPYLVLEFLDGEDLAARLTRGPVPLDEALRMVRQVGSALHAAHRAGVVHRDLKPANIFLCPSDEGGVIADRVKVLDFGISKIRNSQTVQTQDSIILGTPQYMSPEQAAGKNTELDQRTDVFALGAIVYEMLSGRPAFSGENLVAVVFKVVYEPSPKLDDALPGVPAHVAQAVDRALAKQAGDRFPDMGSFVTALTGQKLQTLDRTTAPRLAGAVDPTLAPTETAGQPSPIARPPVDPMAQTGAAAPASVSSAKGEVSPVPPTRIGEAPALAPAPLSGRRGALIGAAIAVILAVGGIVFLRTGPAPAPPVPAAAPALAAAPRPPDLARPADLAIAPAPGLAAPPREAAHVPPHVPRATHEALSPEVAAELDEAERVLGAANPAEATRLARHSLLAGKSSRAFAIMARAACKQGDLGAANASLLNVAASDRPAVRRYCAGAGVDLP